MSRILIAVMLGGTVITGCTPNEPPLPVDARSDARLPLLTMQEAARINGRPLTSTHYLMIRDRINDRDPSEVLWVGAAAIVVEQLSHSPESSAQPKDGMRLALYAKGHLSWARTRDAWRRVFSEDRHEPVPRHDARKMLDRLLSRADIVRNEALLAQID